MTKTINPENWVDDEVTYTLQGNQLHIFDDTFTIDKELMEDGSHTYKIKNIGITAFDTGTTFYAVSDMSVCSREAKDPVDAIVKVIANVL